MKRPLLTALAVLAAVTVTTPVYAGPLPVKKKAQADAEAVSLRVEVKVGYKELKGEVDFITRNAAQSNNVSGGSRAFKVKTPQGEGLEFKKWGLIVNMLPVLDPDKRDMVDAQIQLEISGPIQGKEGVDIETWQLQTEFTAELDKWKVLSRKPAQVSIRVSIAED